MSHQEEAIMASSPRTAAIPNAVTNLNHSRNNHSKLSCQSCPSSLNTCHAPQAKTTCRIKSLLGFVIPEGESILTETFGSKQQAWCLEKKAKHSHLYRKHKPEKVIWKWQHDFSVRALPQLHTSYSKDVPPKLQNRTVNMGPSSQIKQWATFSFKPLYHWKMEFF